jgi:hypothetical protein
MKINLGDITLHKTSYDNLTIVLIARGDLALIVMGRVSYKIIKS